MHAAEGFDLQCFYYYRGRRGQRNMGENDYYAKMELNTGLL